MRKAEIECITEESFRPFGRLIRFPEEDRESNFIIIASDTESPWRLAVFRYWNHSIEKIECHPTSMESFEPLEGETLLLVAEHDTPEDYHIFRLDQPVILEKGVWHQTLSLTDSAQVKITENLEVPTEFYSLSEAVGVE
jgi:ureidoglycolate hydrolase